MIIIVHQPQFSFFKTWILTFFDSQYYIDSKNISYLYVHLYDWFCRLVQLDQMLLEESLKISGRHRVQHLSHYAILGVWLNLPLNAYSSVPIRDRKKTQSKLRFGIFLEPIITESGLRIIRWAHHETLSSNKSSLRSWVSAMTEQSPPRSTSIWFNQHAWRHGTWMGPAQLVCSASRWDRAK